MKHAADGSPLHKSVFIRIIPPEDQPQDKQVFRAPPGKSYTTDNMDDVLLRVASHIEKKYPDYEFRMVQVGPAAFNFVYAGRRGEAAMEAAG